MNWFETYSQYQRVRFGPADRCFVTVCADAVFSIYWRATADAHGARK